MAEAHLLAGALGLAAIFFLGSRPAATGWRRVAFAAATLAAAMLPVLGIGVGWRSFLLGLAGLPLSLVLAMAVLSRSIAARPWLRYLGGAVIGCAVALAALVTWEAHTRARFVQEYVRSIHADTAFFREHTRAEKAPEQARLRARVTPDVRAEQIDSVFWSYEYALHFSNGETGTLLVSEYGDRLRGYLVLDAPRPPASGVAPSGAP